eukprot:4857876-Amphidinium_carterae.1
MGFHLGVVPGRTPQIQIGGADHMLGSPQDKIARRQGGDAVYHACLDCCVRLAEQWTLPQPVMAEITKVAAVDSATLSAAIAQAAPKHRTPMTGKPWHIKVLFTQSEAGRHLAQLFQAFLKHIQAHAARSGPV